MDFTKLNINYPIELVDDFVFSPYPIKGQFKLSSLNLFILIGLTGSGKSTLISKLSNSLNNIKVLPDRRIITTKCIISPLQLFLGEQLIDLKRLDRYYYVSKFREYYPGGMAYILNNTYLRNTNSDFLIFDGLRGENEVEYAVKNLPNTKFIVLNASDYIRIKRLIFRQDQHDKPSVNSQDQTNKMNVNKFNDFNSLFSILELDQNEEIEILSQVNSDQNSNNDLINVLKIVSKDKQLNNPEKVMAYLQNHAPDRSFIYESSKLDAKSISEKVIRDIFLN